MSPCEFREFHIFVPRNHAFSMAAESRLFIILRIITENISHSCVALPTPTVAIHAECSRNWQFMKWELNLELLSSWKRRKGFIERVSIRCPSYCDITNSYATVSSFAVGGKCFLICRGSFICCSASEENCFKANKLISFGSLGDAQAAKQ